MQPVVMYPVHVPLQASVPPEYPSDVQVAPCRSVPSQTSFAMATLSPQTGVQTDGCPVHCQPGSTVQVGLHPSPAWVPPSSHSSIPSMVPLPHPGGGWVHWPWIVHCWLPGQSPQLPPQPSSPHTFPTQSEVQHPEVSNDVQSSAQARVPELNPWLTQSSPPRS